MLPERQWIEWVRGAAGAQAGRREVRLGIGDDAALVRPGRGQEMAVTTDLFLEDVHFLRGADGAGVCGRRLATRALSDLAAMGAEPLALLVSSAYPRELEAAWARGFYRGFLAAAREAGAGLVGGDVSQSPGKICFDVVGLGQVPPGVALRRSGAQVGDRIYVSGEVGDGALGRELAHGGRAAGNARERRALGRHRRPRARWELGMALRGRATAALDVSDGLATELDHLGRASGVGCEIEAAAFSDLERALYGGEDYELVFTLPVGRRPPARARAGVGVREIGRITAGRGVFLIEGSGRRRIQAAGWQHFGMPIA